jgi:hypothetical protein
MSLPQESLCASVSVTPWLDVRRISGAHFNDATFP